MLQWRSASAITNLDALLEERRTRRVDRGGRAVRRLVHDDPVHPRRQERSGYGQPHCTELARSGLALPHAATGIVGDLDLAASLGRKIRGLDHEDERRRGCGHVVALHFVADGTPIT